MMDFADSEPNMPVEIDQVLDTSELRCPMPLLKTKLALNSLPAGARLLVVATDAGSARDIPAFLRHTAHKLISTEELDETFRFLIERG